jgi:hypothetical protein
MVNHMSMSHRVKANFEPTMFECSLCSYDSKTKQRLLQHKAQKENIFIAKLNAGLIKNLYSRFIVKKALNWKKIRK